MLLFLGRCWTCEMVTIPHATNRYSTMTSNVVKSVNEDTKFAKNYVVIALLQSLRQTIHNWFCKHKEIAQDTFATLSSKYET